jgi:hypothetical protein
LVNSFRGAEMSTHYWKAVDEMSLLHALSPTLPAAVSGGLVLRSGI